MRVVDVSVAAVIGLATIASMAVWNPSQLEVQGQAYSNQASMEEYLSAVVSSLGVPWLHRATPSDVCDALSPFSNATIEVSASWREYRCSIGPPPGTLTAVDTLRFPEGNLTLIAWRPGRQ